MELSDRDFGKLSNFAIALDEVASDSWILGSQSEQCQFDKRGRPQTQREEFYFP